MTKSKVIKEFCKKFCIKAKPDEYFCHTDSKIMLVFDSNIGSSNKGSPCSIIILIVGS